MQNAEIEKIENYRKTKGFKLVFYNLNPFIILHSCIPYCISLSTLFIYVSKFVVNI